MIQSNKELKLREEITVKAWWDNDKPVKCYVLSLPGECVKYEYLDVKPLEGNPHARFIKIDRVINHTGIIH